MKSLTQTYLINAPVEKVWEALTDPQVIDDWGAGPAKMSEEEGEEFEIWGGDIHGKNIKVVKNKELVQDWMAGEWDEFSRVTFKLEQKGKKCEVELIQENIPDSE